MLEKLNKLIGISYDYKGKNIIISKVKLVSTSYVVFTNLQTFNFFENEVENFIETLKIKEPKQIKINLPMENTTKDVSKELIINPNIKMILLETLEKLKTDKSYIPQANAICNVVSQMINITKVEIQIANFKK